MDFETIWRKIKEHQGESFFTVSDLPFTYSVHGEVLKTSRTKYNLPKSEFLKAYERFPISSPKDINDLVRGSSYVYAILTDERIVG